jgi:hypothetical protein
MYHEVFKCYFSARKKCFARDRTNVIAEVRQRVEETKQRLVQEHDEASSMLEQLFLVVSSGPQVPLHGITRQLQMAQSTSGSDFTTAIPECFLCPISLEVMRDPVLVVSSDNPQSSFSQVSYERGSIQKHFETNSAHGFFDPVTRMTFGARFPVIVPNLSLRNAIYAFLESHPWLFDEEEG